MFGCQGGRDGVTADRRLFWAIEGHQADCRQWSEHMFSTPGMQTLKASQGKGIRQASPGVTSAGQVTYNHKTPRPYPIASDDLGGSQGSEHKATSILPRTSVPHLLQLYI